MLRLLVLIILSVLSSARDTCSVDASCGAQQTLAANNNVFVAVRSQFGRPHALRVAQMRADWGYYSETSSFQELHIFGEASWAIYPIITKLRDKLHASTKWVVFVEDDTDIYPEELVSLLEDYDSKDHLFIGRALYDREPVIIHHYRDDTTFAYPDFAAGFVLSASLVHSLADNYENYAENIDFTIDPQYELAVFIRVLDKVLLTNDKRFCVNKASNCATLAYGRPAITPLAPVSLSNVLFGVKTAEQFHQTRLAYITSTWAKDLTHIAYYSETKDDTIPTVATGVPNTETGHCAKTEFILKAFARRVDEFPWFVIADDDTAMLVPRLLDLLALYDPADPIVLGQRYGFGLQRPYGYGYITGGGGIVFSRAAIRAIADSKCQCWRIDTPDDMWIGSCAAQIGLANVNYAGFHQAPPQVTKPSDIQSGYYPAQPACVLRCRPDYDAYARFCPPIRY